MLNFFSTLKNKQVSLFMFNLILAIWLGAILNIGFFHSIDILTPYFGVKAILFLAATVVIVVAAYYAVLQILNWTWTAKIFAILLLMIGGFSSYFVNTLGIIISPDQIQNMIQTDVSEVSDLISLRFGLWTIFFVVLPIILITQVKLKKEKVSYLLMKKLGSIVGSCAIVGILLFVYYVDFASIFREHRDLKGMISPQNSISSLMSYYHKMAPKKNLPLIHYGEDAHQVQQVQNNLPKLMVLVVGETARAESFALNGYSKNTNPELSKQDILNFSQVSSCGTATAVSVPCMFSGMPRVDYDEQLASHREGLLDIAKRAGYQVTWIDNNSGCKGACDRVEQYPISEKLKQKWCKDGECYDDILIDSLNEYLATIPKEDTRPRLIVLHQVGSHGPAYYKRAPAQYQPFKPTCDTNAIQGCSQTELLNSYDDTIVYTDHVLSQLIDNLKEVSKYQTGLWYLSDHGESTGEHGLYLHGSPYAIAPSQQTHVPMIMWFSDKWKQHNFAQVSCLSQQTKETLSQDNLFPSLLSLLGVKTQVINPQLDMLHSCAHVN
ncbi:phosphoethanolamine transferase [Acinetobacter pittii]|nr:phosphoethanolamine--lipid A transferase [Acinetobacter pittii]